MMSTIALAVLASLVRDTCANVPGGYPDGPATVDDARITSAGSGILVPFYIVWSSALVAFLALAAQRRFGAPCGDIQGRRPSGARRSSRGGRAKSQSGDHMLDGVANSSSSSSPPQPAAATGGATTLSDDADDAASIKSARASEIEMRFSSGGSRNGNGNGSGGVSPPTTPRGSGDRSPQSDDDSDGESKHKDAATRTLQPGGGGGSDDDVDRADATGMVLQARCLCALFFSCVFPVPVRRTS